MIKKALIYVSEYSPSLIIEKMGKELRGDEIWIGVLPRGRRNPRFHRGTPDVLNLDILDNSVDRDFQSFCKFAKK
ncbi:hypothetical protein MUO65_05915, partial [bacterium]|nr:hypothetical protein [bacterium]